ncbi:hypothetical protein Ct61P_07885 [Colletotrichum tofieldiae]|nr:hypothetical protein Ct61P_07885 [Colletotrichum tofieldiae]
MAPPLNLLIRALVAFEDVIIRQILRSPGFHRGVGRIHRYVGEKRNGPLPHEPLRQGQASGTFNPGGDRTNTRRRANAVGVANPEDRGFAQYFFEELKNQFRGTPSNPPPPGPPKR